MLRSLTLSLGMGLILSISGCGGDSCESVQAQIQELGRELQKDPRKVTEDHTRERLTELRDKLEKLGCLR